LYSYKSKVKAIWLKVKAKPFRAIRYVLVGMIGLFAVFLLSIYIGVFGKIPTADYLKKLKNPVTSTLYDARGESIGLYFLQNRSNVDLAQLPEALKNALVATEDARFYEHGGIDYKSYGRVFIKSIILGQNAGGGSTVTQQVAKNIFGRKKQFFLSTPINKFRELFIARRLESVYSKDEILLLYFNTVSFGENIYGIEKASLRFFNKPPEQLTITESATLVGLLKAPSYYSPRNHPERAERRRNTVLNQMVKYGFLSDEEKIEAQVPLVINYQASKKQSSFSTYYKNFVEAEFNTWAQQHPAPDGHIYNLHTDGLKITTTLNSSIQKSSEKALQKQVERLQVLMDKYWAATTTEGGKEALLDKIVQEQTAVKRMKAKNATAGSITEFSMKVKERDFWNIGKGYEPRLQSLRDSIATSLNRLHAAVFTVNSRSGAILGYVGGIDYGFSQTDNVVTKKQVGSTFKPITYLAALERGQYPCNYYNNTLMTYKQYEDWRPKNASGRYGGSYSMHGALANSVNTVSVQLQLNVGVEKVIEQAKKMGITTTLPEVPSIVLGTAELTLFEMVTAYGSIANGGTRIQPYAIQRIEDEDGNEIYKHTPTGGKRVATVQHVKELQKMMEEVITEGSASGMKNYEIGYNLIGKTGTTQNNGDGWFIGASPEIVVGAWVGTRDKRVHFEKTYHGSGANTAMPMVASVFKGLSSWKSPMLTNFEYDFDYFPCPSFLEMDATEAKTFAQLDTTYLYNLRRKDTLIIDEVLPVIQDTAKVQVVDPIVN
jgi:penicillin-binding protein 1A